MARDARKFDAPAISAVRFELWARFVRTNSYTNQNHLIETSAAHAYRLGLNDSPLCTQHLIIESYNAFVQHLLPSQHQVRIRHQYCIIITIIWESAVLPKP